MSLFPNILDIASYNATLANSHQSHNQNTPPPHRIEQPHQRQHQHHALLKHQHISEMLLDFLGHMFAPTAYMQCTCSTPCWAPASIDTESNYKPKLIIDDDYVVFDEDAETDGGSLHREATIASWKARPVKKERRRSVQWWASVIRRDSVHA